MSDTPTTTPQLGVSASPDLDAALRDAGQAIKAGDMARAFTIAREGLDRGLEHPGLLSLRSLWFEQNGRYEEAVIDLARALELAPGDATILNAQGLVYDKLQRPHEAIAAFEAATVAAPRFAPAFHNLGWARGMVGDLVGARGAYEQAIALKPDYTEPLAHLARMSVSRGDANAARVHANQALRIDPHHPTAAIALAEADLAEHEPAAAETLLQTTLARDNVTPLDRGVALKLLGDALHGQGRFADAFDAYAKGNEELRQLYAPRFRSGRGQTMPEMLRWMVNFMSATKPETWRPRAQPPAGDDAPTVHVFIAGFPRSGATFIENVLTQGPSSAILKDHDALGDAVRDFMADAQDLDHLSRVSEADLEPYRRAYWRRVREAGIEPGGKLFIDRLPLNALRAPLIARLFPRSKMIYVLRDPRDVVIGCFRRRFQMNPTTYEFLTLPGAVMAYDLTMRLAIENRQKLSLGLGLVRYEDVVNEPEAQLLSVAGFLGVELTSDMRAFAAAESMRFMTSDGATQGFYGETVGEWKNYAPQMESMMSLLRPWVQQFGYSTDAKA